MSMEEYKDSDTFETNAIIATIKAYNFGFGDYKGKIADAFLILDLRQIISTSEPEEDEEKDEGEEPIRR